MVAVAGNTSIELRVAFVTVSPVEPAIKANVAVMVADPGLAAVAKPLVPTALLMEAAAPTDDQEACVVRSWVELSE